MTKKVTEFIHSIDGENILINTEYAEAYIPMACVGKADEGNPIACQYGEGVQVVGLFNMRFYDTDDPEDKNASPIRVFKYPNIIVTYPSDQESNVRLQLSSDMNEDSYLVLKYSKGDIMMNARHQKKSQNCESFMNQLIKGKLPKGLSYLDLYFSWGKNFDTNSVDHGVSDVVLQMILSENARSKDDPTVHFRKKINEEGVTLFDYVMHNMVDVCASNSVMNALIFERFRDMLTSSINKSIEGVEQNTTPLEEVLKA